MSKDGPSIPVQIYISIISSILAAAIFSPFMFKIVNSITKSLVGGNLVASDNGIPTPLGIVLHAVVYGLVILAWMQIN